MTITGAGTTTFSQDGHAGSLVVNSLVGSSTKSLDFYAVPIESNASGQIAINFTGTQVRGYGVSGIALRSVPEPASCVLVGLGLVGMAGHGWRKRRRGGSARA